MTVTPPPTSRSHQPVTWADGYGVWHARAATKWQARAAILEELRPRSSRAGLAEHRMRVVPVEGEPGHWVEHWVEEVPGWEPVAPLPGGNDDVWRCTRENCGALVRDSGAGAREAHDAAFHTDDNPEET